MLAYQREGEWREWRPGSSLPSGFTVNADAEARMSAEELAAVGLYAVTQEAVPVGKVATGWALADEGGQPRLRPTLVDAPPARPWQVRKLLLLDRLIAAGLFDEAMQALGGPGSLAYERWQAAQWIDSDDAEVRALLVGIGADPDAILAPE